MAVFKAACGQPAVRQNPTLSYEISELLHHYTEVSVPSIVPLTISILQTMWIDIVLPDTQRHQFMMDAVYGLAGFHLAYLVPQKAVKYAVMAHRYYGRSMEAFQTAVTHVSSDNACAILCFAFFAFMISLASPFAIGPSKPDEAIEGMHASLLAARGFLVLQPLSSPYIKEGMVATWLSSDDTYPSPPPPSLILKLMKDLEQVNKASFFSAQEKAICLKAIKSLQIFFSTVPMEPFKWPAVLTWPAVLPDEFLNLIQVRHPIALITLLHWFLPICRGSGQHWLLSRWEKPLLDSILREIGGFWRFAIADLLSGYSDYHHAHFSDREISQLAISKRCLAQEDDGNVEVPEIPIYLVHPDVRSSWKELQVEKDSDMTRMIKD